MHVTEADLERYSHGSELRHYVVAELAKIGNGNNQYTGDGGSSSGELEHTHSTGGPAQYGHSANADYHYSKDGQPVGRVRYHNSEGNYSVRKPDGRQMGETQRFGSHGEALSALKELVNAGKEIAGQALKPIHGGGE